MAAWLRRRMSSSSSRPMRVPSLVLGTVVILSTIKRHNARSVFRSFGCTGRPEERDVCRVRGEGADGDRVGGVEAVVLKDDDGAWLACVVLAAGERPDFASLHATGFHSISQSVTASMNAWSSLA